ncbi:alpha/beta hydrolase [Chryseolinea sp. H1M3-3]|uniref:alpha/beta hydrolase n=1 Tax=Chryseolinea sp. H1M3-3 TaxID=3034144 RepID=UPI0023EAE672|nr:alpha/beta hydrolase [Chryseolinea sp. H1M3-3]
MKNLIPLILATWVTLSSSAIAQKLADPILLWPNGAPGATGTTDEDKPAIIPFIPEPSKRNGAAILVVPGGGFTIRAVDHEGVLVAQWLKDHGITAFVLRYRLRPLYTRTDWVKDGQRAMQYIRSNARDYNISPERVGAIGFSAGANLIADMTLNAIPGQGGTTDPLDRFSTRPDFMILAYGALQIPSSVDSATVANLPPTFMYGTAEDRGATAGMVELYHRMFRAGAPVEAHFFRNGVHGSGFAIGDPVLGTWTALLYNWMAAGGYLTDKPQIALSGVIKLDGKPLIKGMAILTPVNRPEAPPVVIYMNNTGTGEMGRFTIPANQGPVEGKYRIEVRQDATRWISNSRHPFMIEMMAKQRDGTLTEQDKRAWGEFLRKRDLSPSIDNQHVFARQRPNDKSDYVVDIKKGEEMVIEVFSK